MIFYLSPVDSSRTVKPSGASEVRDGAGDRDKKKAPVPTPCIHTGHGNGLSSGEVLGFHVSYQ